MGLKPQLTNIEKLIIVPQSDDRFIDLRKSIDKNAGELIANTNIIGSLAIKTDNIMSSIPTLMEGLTTIFFSPYEEFGNTAIDFITNLKNIYSINSTDVYAIIFKESIDVILRAIAEGNYSSKQIQQYLRNFNAEHPIQGLWEYYFQ
ncbi:MAG: hypothetical protein LBG59_03925 [Candidatus Peribacteria bacterium]|nr:hypothetical protein [Candidatus Peribacteria bacterium]